MKKLLKKLILAMAPLADLIGAPLVLASACILYLVRRIGVANLAISKKILLMIGVFPILDRYEEPLFNPANLKKPLRDDRDLIGIDFNVPEQLELLEKFNFNAELIEIPLEKSSGVEFFFHNGAFGSGDAEYLYNIIRLFKPVKIIEIGSGYSTLMTIKAINNNNEMAETYACELICIEPYGHPWLAQLGVTLIKDLVENVDTKLFKTLGQNDILFIDSSHVIRPQGDVLREILEILPLLNTGVLIHFHDIFTPKDYLTEWVTDEILLYNEQYLLEAFLSFNKEFRIIGMLNYLRHHYTDLLASKHPILAKEMSFRQPGSFWIIKN